MRLGLAIRGDLEKVLRAELRGGEIGATAGIGAATIGLKGELRGQVSAAGMGRRLANTWRSQTFPRGGRSLGAAGVVFSKAPQIIRAFDDGAVIRSKDGFFLAIPTPAAPKKGIGGKRINPSNFPEHRFGRLRFVPGVKGRGRGGKLGLLVVDGVVARSGKRGGFRRATVRKATKRRGAFVSLKGLATVVMFILVPQVRLPKKLDVSRAAARWQAALPGLVLANWPDLKEAA